MAIVTEYQIQPGKAYPVKVESYVVCSDDPYEIMESIPRRDDTDIYEIKGKFFYRTRYGYAESDQRNILRAFHNRDTEYPACK